MAAARPRTGPAASGSSARASAAGTGCFGLRGNPLTFYKGFPSQASLFQRSKKQGHHKACCWRAQDKAPIVEVLEERLLAASQDRAAAAASAAAAEDAEELAAAQVTMPLRNVRPPSSQQIR